MQMQTLRIIAVGKIKDSWLRQGLAEYQKRLAPMAKLQIIELEEEKAPETLSAKEEDRLREKEGERILRCISGGEYSIALNLKGKNFSSPQLAELLQQLGVKGFSTVNFIIGGSIGLGQNVLQAADLHWCLSELTFPHQLCRVILAEQFYRAFSIQHNLPYHK